MRKLTQLTLVALMGVITMFTSCDKEETPVVGTEDDNGNVTTVTDDTDNNDSTNTAMYIFDGTANGVFISNEGVFGAGNGSISFYDMINDTIINNVFSTVNARPLGDVVQSISLYSESKAFICVNASNKVEVVDQKTFQSIGTVENIPGARYYATDGTYGYVSSWGSSQVKVIDPESLSIVDSIAVGSGPEQMLALTMQLFVANSGGYADDHTVSVIDMALNTVSETITLSAYNPSAMVADADNNIWVLAKGKAIYDSTWTVVGHEPSKLYKIETPVINVVDSIELFTDKHPSSLGISPDGNTLYVGGGWGFQGIYSIETTADSIGSASPLIDELNYGFVINPDNGYIFLLKEAYTSNGSLSRYTADGAFIKSYEIGLYPGGGTTGMQDDMRMNIMPF